MFMRLRQGERESEWEEFNLDWEQFYEYKTAALIVEVAKKYSSTRKYCEYLWVLHKFPNANA